MIIDTDNITEDEAMTAYHALARRFGWGGTFFTRADAEDAWRTHQLDQETGLEDDARLPDDVWDAVMSSWYWRKGLTDSLTEHGWTMVHDAVAEAMES